MNMNKKITAIFAALLILLSTVPLSFAQTEAVTTEAVISAGSIAAPTILKAFVLADDGDTSLHTDTRTQVMPPLGVGMDETDKTFWKYVIVSSPGGYDYMAAVYEKLFDPLGILKPDPKQSPISEEVMMTLVDCTADAAEIATVLQDARDNNLITVEEYALFTNLLDADKRQAKMFKIDNSLNNHNIPGVYTLWLKAVDAYGTTTINDTYTFDYMTSVGFEIDFSVVSYGQIIPGFTQIVSGDEVLDLTDGMPTIKNQGNIPIQINVTASNLLNEINQYILAENLSVALLGDHRWDLTAGQIIPAIDNPDGLLMPCTPRQLDFDINAPVTTGEGTYTGTMTIDLVIPCP